MSEPEIVEVDPAGPVFEQWFGVLAASAQAARPGEPDWLAHELRADAVERAAPGADTAGPLLLARLAERPVGAVSLELPQRDNTHLVELDLAVHPSARRRGVARALLAEVERRARACPGGSSA